MPAPGLARPGQGFASRTRAFQPWMRIPFEMLAFQFVILPEIVRADSKKKKKEKERYAHVEIEQLSEFQRDVLRQRLSGYTLSEIGESHGITGERVRQMLSDIRNGIVRRSERIGLLEKKIQKLEEELQKYKEGDEK